MQPVPNLVVADRFRLTRLIGRGGMGSVWLAQHLGLDIPCAMKFIEGDHAQLPEAHARFEREAKAAAQLRSPHVVQILDHGVWQGTPYMAMEMLEGEDLGKRLAKLGRMPPRDICTVITQVARALTKAHAAGIVHRDLKPDNVFLVRDDDREIAKVLDFGIAKQQSTALEGGATKTGAMLGTPYYMSPEQAQGIKAVDHRSDLWSLAVIVYVAATGRLPFESEALGDLLVKIIVAPIPMPSHVAPDLPLAFDRWWAKAANRDPAQRYQSAKELSDGLGLVFGQSQMTDVMDRAELRAAMSSDPALMSARAVTHTPANYAPAATPGLPYTTPQPLHNTPQPMYGGPHPMHATPQPVQGAPQLQYGAPMQGSPHVITGDPMARTFGEGPQPAVSQSSRAAVIVAALVGLCLLVGVGALAVHGRHAAGAPSTALVTAPPVAPPAAPIASATPSASASTEAVAAVASTSAAVTPPAAPVAPPSRPNPPPVAPAPAKPTPKAAPKGNVDLGI